MSTTPFRVEITRDVITATGKDARTFLHSQLSNDIAALKPGAVTHAFILDPSGKLNAFFRVRCMADDHFVLDVDAGCGAAALARLNKFKIRVQCDFALSTEAVVAVRGLAADSALLALPSAVPAWRSGDGAVDIFAAQPDAPTAGIAAIRMGTHHEYHAERVRCAWPIFGIDITDTSLPAETGLVDVAVSFTKGCYPGQELVERMDSRGSTAPRMLMRLPASMGAARAEAGQPYRVAAVTTDADHHGSIDVGMCTSVAGNHALVQVARAHLALVISLHT
jgi:folate-binding protein YgfZ